MAQRMSCSRDDFDENARKFAPHVRVIAAKKNLECQSLWVARLTTLPNKGFRSWAVCFAPVVSPEKYGGSDVSTAPARRPSFAAHIEPDDRLAIQLDGTVGTARVVFYVLRFLVRQRFQLRHVNHRAVAKHRQGEFGHFQGR